MGDDACPHTKIQLDLILHMVISCTKKNTVANSNETGQNPHKHRVSCSHVWAYSTLDQSHQSRAYSRYNFLSCKFSTNRHTRIRRTIERIPGSYPLSSPICPSAGLLIRHLPMLFSSVLPGRSFREYGNLSPSSRVIPARNIPSSL